MAETITVARPYAQAAFLYADGQHALGDWSDMLALLPQVRPLYVSIHERKVGRTRWINGLTLQMSHPAFE